MEKMVEFRLHGRGGQGIVIAAAVFAEAVFLEGLYARAFSLFGAERRGAPVTAFVRAGPARLMPRCRIHSPGYVVVLDPTLGGGAILAGLRQDSVLLVNTAGENNFGLLQELPPALPVKVYGVNAAAIAAQHGLTIGGIPVVNTVMVGALAKISALATLQNVLEAMQKRVGARLEANTRAVTDGYHRVKEVGRVAC